LDSTPWAQEKSVCIGQWESTRTRWEIHAKDGVKVSDHSCELSSLVHECQTLITQECDPQEAPFAGSAVWRPDQHPWKNSIIMSSDCFLVVKVSLLHPLTLLTL
jgi:hypothetical protein